MTELITYNIDLFVNFLRTNNYKSNPKLIYFQDVVKYFENSLGGCGCNKNVRVQFANDFYENMVKSLNEQNIKDLKEVNFAKKIIFMDRNNNVLKEI